MVTVTHAGRIARRAPDPEPADSPDVAVGVPITWWDTPLGWDEFPIVLEHGVDPRRPFYWPEDAWGPWTPDSPVVDHFAAARYAAFVEFGIRNVKMPFMSTAT